MGIKSSKPKLSKEDLDFLKKNTSFTEEQIKEWYKGFVVSFPFSSFFGTQNALQPKHNVALFICTLPVLISAAEHYLYQTTDQITEVLANMRG